MHDLLGLIIATFCLLWLPTQAQAGKASKVFRDCPGCPKMVVIPSGSFAIADLRGRLWRKGNAAGEPFEVQERLPGGQRQRCRRQHRQR